MRRKLANGDPGHSLQLRSGKQLIDFYKLASLVSDRVIEGMQPWWAHWLSRSGWFSIHLHSYCDLGLSTGALSAFAAISGSTQNKGVFNWGLER